MQNPDYIKENFVRKYLNICKRTNFSGLRIVFKRFCKIERQ